MRRLLQALAILLTGAALSGLSLEGQSTRLRRTLTEGLPEERMRAAAELRTLRPSEAAPLLTLALNDPELSVQTLAVEAAIALRWAPALERTRTLFDADEPAERRLASLAEGALGNAESIPALTRALADARAMVREAAATALGQLALAGCATALGSALDDPDTSVRVSAARALGATPGPRATDFLLARSLDRTSEVRAAVMRALAERASLEPERILPVLASSLEDESEAVRLAATLGLGRARDARGIETLLGRVTPLLESRGDASATARSSQAAEARAALAALGRIDAPRARETLLRALAAAVLRDTALEGLAHQAAINEPAVSAAFAEALHTTPTQLDLLASALVAAPHPGPVLADALLERSTRAEGDPSVVLPALALSTSPYDEGHRNVVVHILARLEDRPSRRGALHAVRLLAERGWLDDAAREALVEATHAHADEDSSREALQALAAVSPRPVDALLAYEEDATRATLLTALIDAADPRVEALALRAIVDAQPDARASALAFFRLHPSAHALAFVLDAASASASVDRFSLIECVALLAGQADAQTLPRVQDLLRRALHADDPRRVGAAAAGLHSGGTEAHRALLEQLAPSSTSVALMRARAGLADEVPLAAWLGARVSAETAARDFALQEDFTFPASITRSYVALTLARSGVLAPQDASALCALAERREPSVRANAALALAAMRARCEGIDPLRWVEQGLTGNVRLAGLAWFAALRDQDLDVRSRRVLVSCAEGALDARVAARCAEQLVEPHAEAASGIDAAWTWVDVTALDAHDTPLTLHWVTLEFEDGSSLATRTDECGRVAMRVPSAQLAHLADPFASVLAP